MKSYFTTALWALWVLHFPIFGASFGIVKWNKHVGEFQPIFRLFSHGIDRRDIELLNQQQESLNLNGRPLEVTYTEDLGFFHFHDNDTRATGVCGDIYTILAEFLNFTSLVLSNDKHRPAEGTLLPNGSYVGILEYARLNQTDVIPKVTLYGARYRAGTFTPAFWMNSQRIFAHEDWKRSRFWMFNIFPITTWGFIGLAALTLSIVSFVIERVLIRDRGRQLRSRSYADHLFVVISVMNNQVDEMGTTARRSKILAFTISCFCWLLTVTYNSYMIYHMTKETYDAPFNDLEELFKNTNYHIAVLHGSFAHALFTSTYSYQIFMRLWKAKRVKVLSNIEELFHQVCFNPHNYVLLDAEDAMAARKFQVCNLIPIGTAYYVTPIASGISRKFKNKRSLDVGILKLHEFGVLKAIKQRYLSPPKREVGYRLTDSLAIDMDGVLVIFGILGVGVFASLVICIAENVYFKFKNRETVQSLMKGTESPKIIKKSI